MKNMKNLSVFELDYFYFLPINKLIFKIKINIDRLKYKRATTTKQGNLDLKVLPKQD